VSRSTPVFVSNVVCSTLVPATYARVTRCSATGAIEKWPADRSRIAPNIEAPEKIGRHSHSTEPRFETSAAVRQLPISA
jgi:hypothetical protein